jgi:hypothetical protein
MVVRCPVGVSVSGLVIEVHVCSSNSVGIDKAVLWRVQCNWARNRSNGEDIMVVRCPVRRLGIVRRDRSCMLEQWATIHRYHPCLGSLQSGLCGSRSCPLLCSFLSFSFPPRGGKEMGSPLAQAQPVADETLI